MEMQTGDSVVCGTKIYHGPIVKIAKKQLVMFEPPSKLDDTLQYASIKIDWPAWEIHKNVSYPRYLTWFCKKALWKITEGPACQQVEKIGTPLVNWVIVNSELGVIIWSIGWP